MHNLKKRSQALTAYFEYLLNGLKQDNSDLFDIMTPTNPEERGSQLSVRFKRDLQVVHEEIEKRGVVVSSLSYILLIPISEHFLYY